MSGAQPAFTGTQLAFAITTTFTPAQATCTQSSFTVLGPAKADYIFLNYPDPVPGTLLDACYPSQWLSSYLLQESVTTPLPAIQPLICPAGYSSIPVPGGAPDGYLACCPSSMGLALSSPTQADRPAFGGKCYTPISTITVTAYGDQSVTATSIWSTPAAVGAQAYAMPIEGYAFATSSSSSPSISATLSALPVVTASTSTPMSPPSSTSPSSTTSTTSPPISVSKSTSHTGAIIGGVLAGLALLALLALALFFMFIRPRRHKHNHNNHNTSNNDGRRGSLPAYTADHYATEPKPPLHPYAQEIGGYEAAPGKIGSGGVHEMQSDSLAEMEQRRAELSGENSSSEDRTVVGSERG